MKSIRTKAIVLRRTNYGEADRVVQILTPDHGKMSIMAKGVRREKSKLAGGIELFSRTDITVMSGKGDMGTLTGARSEVFYKNILNDYDRLQFAYEVVKQVAKAADMLDEPAFFELLDQALEALNDEATDLRIIKTWFWLQLGILLGIGANLATDGNGMKLVEDVTYHFNVSDQVFEYREQGKYTSEHIKTLRVLSGNPPKVAARINGIERCIDDCLWVAEHTVAH